MESKHTHTLTPVSYTACKSGAGVGCIGCPQPRGVTVIGFLCAPMLNVGVLSEARVGKLVSMDVVVVVVVVAAVRVQGPRQGFSFSFRGVVLIAR
jgi:hypothetical protein